MISTRLAPVPGTPAILRARRRPRGIPCLVVVSALLAACGGEASQPSAAEAVSEAREAKVVNPPPLGTPGPPLFFQMATPSNGDTFPGLAPSQVGVTVSGNASWLNLEVDVQVATMADVADDNWTQVGVTHTTGTAAPYKWTLWLPPGTIAGAVPWQDGGLVAIRAVPNTYNVMPMGGASSSCDNDDVATCHDPAHPTSTCYDPALLTSACPTTFDWATVLVSTHEDLESSLPSPQWPQYLQAPSPQPPVLTVSNAGVPSFSTGNYYANINAPATLAAFKTRYGFGAGGDQAAVYANLNELGLGRRMHCWSWTNLVPSHGQYHETSNNRACYVSNYAPKVNADKGQPQTTDAAQVGFARSKADADAALALAIADPTETHALATVAMVSTVALSGPPKVSFMAYDAAGALTEVAALDTAKRNVAVPANCMTCHGAGGSYDTSTGTITGASFLAFDKDALYFTEPGSQTSTANGSTYTWTNQQGAIRGLNVHVLGSQPASGVADLLHGMYPPPNLTDGLGPVFTSAYVPSGWAGTPESTKLYTEVVKPYCRTCHTTTPSNSIYQLTDFATFTNPLGVAPSIADHVCGQNKFAAPMPAAEQTSLLFWASPARAYLADALNLGSDCNPGP
jgi:mono/diheme cytochrome c family protein